MSSLHSRIQQLENNQPGAMTDEQLRESLKTWQRFFSDSTARVNVKANAQRYPGGHWQHLARILELIEIAEKRAQNERLTK